LIRQVKPENRVLREQFSCCNIRFFIALLLLFPGSILPINVNAETSIQVISDHITMSNNTTDNQLLPTVEINPAGAIKASVIWLHGLGADGHDFEPIVEHLDLPADEGIRFVFPHAPRRAVTINGGYVMRAWYDVADADLSTKEDSDGIKQSARQVRALIQRELDSGIDSSRIVLAGFSQGGAIALYTGLRYERPLAGILALSTYLPLADSLDKEKHTANQKISIMMAHGTNDPIIPIATAERSKTLLVEQGFNIEWHTYPMPHAVVDDEIKDISQWLQQVLLKLRS